MRPLPCSSCPRNKHSEGFVPASGSLDAKLIVLGEQPGTNEVREGKPFVGKSGDELTIGLGGSRTDVYITNVRKCLGKEGESAALRASSIDHCVRSYLSDEFDSLLAARTILVVGADAAMVVIGRKDITKIHGSVYSRNEVEAMRNVDVQTF